MKKIANFLFIISICLFLVACHHDGNDIIIQETGATPTHDFSVCNYLKDNAVFSQNQEFVISGVSENGVLIKVEIYNQDGSMILAASDIADNNGEFSVKLIAPKGSYNKHKIVINDSVHVHEYNNILFGEVWLFAGEQLSDVDNTDVEYNENVRVFDYVNNEYVWSSYNINTTSYVLTYKFGEVLRQNLNVPVAVIDSTLPYGNADAWISHFTASNQLKINNYLKSINRYIPSAQNIVLKTNTLSSMYMTYLNELNGISVNGMIWQQGKSDFDIDGDVNIDKLLSDYTYLTSNIFLEYINFFNGNLDVYSIQNGFINIEYANELRSGQEFSTYLVNNVHIIPTYDCHVSEHNLISEDVNYVFSSNKYIQRITQNILEYTYQKKSEEKNSMFTNAVINGNTIVLTFSNDINLEFVENIYGLNITTIDGYIIEYNFEIEDNKIYLQLNDFFFNEDIEFIISYGFNNDLYKCNLYNEFGNPVLPFRIEVNN